MTIASVPILMIPGWSNSDPGHWQTRWERALPSCVRVEQRDWLTPDVDEWIATIDNAVARAPLGVILVAHSLGCIAIAHWAAFADVTRGARIRAALLVAPADVEAATAPPETRGFAPIPRVQLPFYSRAVASTTDSYCTMTRAREFAKSWGSELVDVGDAGHINTASGNGPWSEGERLLQELVAMTRDQRGKVV